MGAMDHTAPQPVASPPIQHQDAGPVAHLPPTYQQAHGPGSPAQGVYQQQTGSPAPGMYQQAGSPAPVMYQQQTGSPAPGMYHQQTGSPAPGMYQQAGSPPAIQQAQPQYLSNPTGNPEIKHEPQHQVPGQQGMVAAVVPLEHLDNNPQWIDCPWCQKRTHTRVEKEGSSMQILTGVVLCLLCVCLACLPCIAGWFEDTHQFCSNCGKKVSTRTHEGHLQVFRPAQGFAVASQFPSQQVLQQQQQQQQAPQQSGKVA